MSDMSDRARTLIPHIGTAEQAQTYALIAIAEALERIATVKERTQAEDSRRRASVVDATHFGDWGVGGDFEPEKPKRSRKKT